jgi:fibronectin type 3 domain-containing protein
MAHQVVLNWTASATPGALYGVYRGTTSGGESGTAINTPSTATTFTDTNVVAGSTYFYEVAAIDPSNGNNVSAPSNEVSVTIPTIVRPDAPVNLVAAAS